MSGRGGSAAATALEVLRVLGCLGLIAMLDVIGRVAGMRRVLRLVNGRRVRPGRGRAGADEVAARVALAAAFYPRRALCLEQSLALCWLLRRGGQAAQLRIGVQPRPFLAHAWVEVDGEPVAERSDLLLQLAAFPQPGV